MSQHLAWRMTASALATVTLAGGIATAPAASADSGLLELSVAYQSAHALYIDVCLTTDENLPATVGLAYTISAAAGVVATDSWDGGTPGTVFLEAPSCPAGFTQFVTTRLTPGTAYTVQVTATVTPMVEDESFELAPDPAGYPAFNSTTSLAVSTLPGDPEGNDDENPGTGVPAPGADGGGSTGGGTGGSGSSGGGSSGGSPTTLADASADSAGSVSTGSPPVVLPVVIPDPAAFKPAQLTVLSPAQVATIAPSAFGQLLPAAFAALTPDQAAAVTPEQASAIRPARAAVLTPRAVAALDAEALVALRPSAVAALSAAAVAAMTTSQLRALTPRQVAALRQKQVAGLTPAQKALLRR